MLLSSLLVPSKLSLAEESAMDMLKKFIEESPESGQYTTTLITTLETFRVASYRLGGLGKS